jgi:PAS domain S-box-containing protein
LNDRAQLLVGHSIATRILLVVLGLYLVIACTVTAGQLWLNFRYQKVMVQQALEAVEAAFGEGIAVSLWNMDEEALKATAEGMLKIPSVVGVQIVNVDQEVIALGGLVTENNRSGNVGFHISFAGLSDADRQVHQDEPALFELFTHRFSAIYQLEGKSQVQGYATIYSSHAVIYKRMKVEAIMVGISVGVTLIFFFFALQWTVSRYLRRPLRILTEATTGVSLDTLAEVSVDTGISGQNELKVLEDSFNEMIRNLHQSIVTKERAELLLLESEERFVQAAEQSGTFTWEVDADGLFTYVHPVVEEVVGFTPSEIIGTLHFYDLHPKEGRERLRDLAFESFKKKEVLVGLENLIQTKEGQIIWVVTSGIPLLNEAGDLVGYRGSDTDINQRKCAEEEVRAHRDNLEEKVTARTAELSRSNAELEQFAYIASHDLQEPLRMVTSYMQLIEKRYKEKLDEDGIEFIEFAVDGAKRMKTLIGDLLTYSRVGSKEKPFESVDCGRVLEKALSNLEIAIEESGAEITHAPLPTVRGDEVQLVQLFQNLIGNAIKFRGDQPPEIQIRAEEEGSAWRFSVQDNGIGIKPEYFEMIFQVFKRLHGRGEYDGTGIGLAVCRKIISRHGGTLDVESHLAEGATFRFTISK